MTSCTSEIHHRVEAFAEHATHECTNMILNLLEISRCWVWAVGPNTRRSKRAYVYCWAVNSEDLF